VWTASLVHRDPTSAATHALQQDHWTARRLHTRPRPNAFSTESRPISIPERQSDNLNFNIDDDPQARDGHSGVQMCV
jgi:hypothetical protein